MATEAQILANRRNAQKSTGPRTPEAKAAVSQNAVKHGLFASQTVISSESQAEFDLYREQFLEELAPVSPMESMLAERIVSLSWRLKRTERIQNQAIDALDERNDNSPFAKLTKSILLKLQPTPSHACLERSRRAPTESTPDLPLGRLAIKDFTNARILDRLLMYERRIENSLHKTILELQRLNLIKNIDTEHEAPPNQSTNEPFTTTHEQIMQNKANLPNAQISITDVPIKTYTKNDAFAPPKNKANSNPKQTQNKPNLRKTNCGGEFFTSDE